MRQDDYPGMVVRQKAPLNLEGQFSSVRDWITPTPQFFVRSHFPAPALDAEAWRLKVHGCVDRPAALSLKEITALSATTLAATVECAGNGRVYYEPAKEGLQWQAGAVGNASWTGVRLRDLLELAGVQDRAVDVILVGADRGVVDGGKKTASPGPIAFARSLPIRKAMESGTLLAYEMNGEPLTVQHGFPLRAVVGGWFGMAWVKWIKEIRVVERPFLGYWQARDYFRWEREMGEPVLVPLDEMLVKAQIARPISGSEVLLGQRRRIFGAAWGGEAPIVRVEVSVEDDDWQPATLIGPEACHAWRFWETHWTPERAGRYSLLCRAFDAEGRVQPPESLPDRESYMANWSVPVEVTVVEREEAEGFEI
ncbi:MAG TPA: sulfite oxidase [Chthonomonadaceae bacterium]|nr:sulfite oxidase [Chthonomonadaceae bacterium]